MRIRCWVHKMQNVLSKVPDEAREEVKEHLRSIRDVPDWATGKQLAERFIQTYKASYSRAVNCFADDMEASLIHLQLPTVHRTAVRSTNLIERAFGQHRRRTKVIPRFSGRLSPIQIGVR